MAQNTYISDVLEGNDCKDRYDTQVKKILSDKTVLAWILKYTTGEFAPYSIEKIKECIEGTPEVGTHPVYPASKQKNENKSKRKQDSKVKDSAPEAKDSVSEAITGSDTVDKVPGEGMITYDIRFYAITPTKNRIKLILNVEAQKEFDTGYDLVTRGIFYCARMISAQKGTEFKKSNYNDLKKVYSIWICMNVSKDLEYTITSYKLDNKESRLRDSPPAAGRYKRQIPIRRSAIPRSVSYFIGNCAISYKVRKLFTETIRRSSATI